MSTEHEDGVTYEDGVRVVDSGPIHLRIDITAAVGNTVRRRAREEAEKTTGDKQ